MSASTLPEDTVGGTRDSPSAPRSTGGPWAASLWLALAVGLVLRVWEGTESSLWLDELHTLFHASRASIGEVLQSVRADNHTPLFFFAVHLFGDWADGPALRWLPIVTSLAALPLLVAILRDAGAGRAWILTSAWLWAVLPYQIHYAAELRPYAWLGLFSMAAFWVAFTARGPGWARFLGFTLFALLGLLTHRAMAISIFAIGGARLCVPREKRLGLGWLILAGAIAVAGFVPWLLSFADTMTEIRFDYQEEQGGYTFRRTLQKEILALPLRLVMPYIGWLGEGWSRAAGLVIGPFFALLGLALGLRLWRGRREPESRQLANPVARGLIVFAVVAFLLVTAFPWYSWDRVPLQYFTLMAWVLPLLFGNWLVAPSSTALRRSLTCLTIVCGLALGVTLAGGRSREGVRDGVALLREWGRECELRDPRPEGLPFYTARMSQPAEVFDEILPYLAYAPELDAVEPEELPGPGELGFERPVLVYRRVLSMDHPSWQPILAGRRVVRHVRLDSYITVYEFGPEQEPSEPAQR